MRPNKPLDIGCASSAAVVHADILRRVGSNVDAEVLVALSAVPGCLESLWAAIEPAYNGCVIRSAAAAVRQEATELAAASVHFPDHLGWLKRQGFSSEDIRQIRYVVESFYSLEPVFAVMAAFAREWLRSSDAATCYAPADCPLTPGPVLTGEVLIPGTDEHIWNLFPRQPQQEPPGHPFYRALSVWPRYAEAVHDDLNNPACAVPFGAVLEKINVQLNAISTGAAGYVRACPSTVAAAGLSGPIERCMRDSAEVIALVSALRYAFIKSEVSARNRRTHEQLEHTLPAVVARD